MSGFKTGDVGENWVQLWASQAGITVNPVRRDETGWDFCFQLRRDHSGLETAPLDRLPPELTCWIQVKTTMGGAKSHPVKLSNWERMVKDPFPWFFICVCLDERGDATEASLVHVNETWIERVLRRLREVPVDAADTLHKRTLDLTWRDEAPLPVPIAAALKDGIRACVGNLDDYIARKAVARRNLGYERDSRYEVTVTTGLSRSKADIEFGVDFALGLEKRLPISALLMKDVRFNVPKVLEEKSDLADGYIEFATVPSIGATKLVFSDRRRTRSTSLTCETYVPTLLFPNLPKEYFKVRMVHPLVSIITIPATLKMNLSWLIPDADPVPLRDLAAAGDLLLLLASATSDNGVTVAYESDGKTVEIGYADAPIEPSASVRELAVVGQHASFVAKYFDLPDTTLVRPMQLHRQVSQLTCLRAVVDRTAGSLAIGVGIAGDASLEGKRAAIVLPMSARIGEFILAASVVYAGPARWDEESKRLSVEHGEAKVLAKAIVPVKEWEPFGHHARTRQLAEQLSNGSEYDLVTGPRELDDDDDG